MTLSSITKSIIIPVFTGALFWACLIAVIVACCHYFRRTDSRLPPDLTDFEDCVDDHSVLQKTNTKTGEMFSGRSSNDCVTNTDISLPTTRVIELVEDCTMTTIHDTDDAAREPTARIARKFFRIVHAYPAWFRAPPNVADLKSIPNDSSFSDDTNDWKTRVDFNYSTSVKSDLASIESSDSDDRHSIV
jgi:hypothetical protein